MIRLKCCEVPCEKDRVKSGSSRILRFLKAFGTLLMRWESACEWFAHSWNRPKSFEPPSGTRANRSRRTRKKCSATSNLTTFFLDCGSLLPLLCRQPAAEPWPRVDIAQNKWTTAGCGSESCSGLQHSKVRINPAAKKLPAGQSLARHCRRWSRVDHKSFGRCSYSGTPPCPDRP